MIGVSDYKVSNRKNETIITYALGSCLGIAIYDPVVRVGGLLHVMLPLSKMDPEKAQKNPAMFVDSGLSLLLKKMYRLGASKNKMIISVAGGASMKKSSRKDHFKIGKRNYTSLRKLLWKNGFIIAGEDVGGGTSRTMALRIADGRITINKQPIEVNN